MLWHSIPILYSIWHLFWHTIWHIFWHYFWHSICTCSDILSGIYSGILSGTYSGILFWHSFWQSIWLSIWHLFWYSIWHSILAFFLAFYLAFILTIFLAFIWQKASGWGPAVPTEIWSSRLRSGCWFGDSHTLSKCSLSFVSQWRGCSNDWDLALQIYNIQCLNSLSCLLGLQLVMIYCEKLTQWWQDWYGTNNTFGEHWVLVCWPVLYIQQLVGKWCHVLLQLQQDAEKILCL